MDSPHLQGYVGLSMMISILSYEYFVEFLEDFKIDMLIGKKTRTIWPDFIIIILLNVALILVYKAIILSSLHEELF